MNWTGYLKFSIMISRFAVIVTLLLFACLQGCAAQHKVGAEKTPELSVSAKAEISRLTRAIATAPTADNYAERGRVYFHNKHFAEAVQDDSRAIQLNPRKSFYWFSRGVDYVHQAEWDKAISDATKAIELSKKGDPIYINALRVRGLSYYRLGRNKLADADMSALEAVGAAP